MKTFIPFHKIKDQEVIVVDGLHPHNLTLSHWKGANCHSNIAADTSAEIVFNALLNNMDGIHCNKISATHFDIDGFVGVFALFHPDLALQHRETLIQMATIGDFREYNPTLKYSEEALKLSCWMNTIERKLFYRPFEVSDEIESCVSKFEYFLKKFPEVLQNIQKFESEWIEEYEQVKKGMFNSIEFAKDKKHPKLGLFIRRSSFPTHYYAQFSGTKGYDMVLSIYSDQRYELEYKYTSWVDIASRASLPRIEFQELILELNEIEESSFRWSADKITDTGPILRLEEQTLSKADRFANPAERTIFSSSIDAEQFCKVVINFYKLKYRHIHPKRFWSWKEMKFLKQND